MICCDVLLSHFLKCPTVSLILGNVTTESIHKLVGFNLYKIFISHNTIDLAKIPPKIIILYLYTYEQIIAIIISVHRVWDESRQTDSTNKSSLWVRVELFCYL